jgi:hypothetical protein
MGEWYARRKVVFEGEFQSRVSTHAFVEIYLRDMGMCKPTPVKVKGE